MATLREVTIGPDAGELLAAGDQYRLIKLNPDAALQKRILHDGFVPTSNEFDYADQRKQPPVYYVGQQAERLSDKIVRVYYCRVNDLGECAVCGEGVVNITISLLFLVCALVCFLIAAFKSPWLGISWRDFGFAFVIASALFTGALSIAAK